MDRFVKLEPFLHEFSNLASSIQQIVPEVNHCHVTDAAPECSDCGDSEVYSGLPTIFNSQKIALSLSKCIPETSDIIGKYSESVRPLLIRLELIAIWANTYNLTELECHVWRMIASVGENSGRFLDASYALVNHALVQLLVMESEPNVTEDRLRQQANELYAQLRQNASLLDAVEETVRNGQLPTPHSHFQCVIVSMATAYLEHYGDWTNFVSKLDLIPIYFNEFFTTKSWAAVCARGYLYWIRLHARCLFASNVPHEQPLPTADQSREAFQNKLLQATIIPLPNSILHAANLVRIHGRTVVKFMRNACELKLNKQQQKTNKVNSQVQSSPLTTSEGDENKENNSQPDRTESSSSKTFAWSSTSLSDSDLLNLWLGTRLLIRGCLQVAELHTLLGTVREARAFQDELLKMSQRFHLCGYAQKALTLMAHLDMFGQRKWAFELRLRQLQHIYISTLSLDEIARETKRFKTSNSTRKSSGDNEEKFLKSNASIPNQKQPVQRDVDAFDVNPFDSLSVAANPLIAANTDAFASIFPCSPTKDRSNPTSLLSFPSPSRIQSLIMGGSHGQTYMKHESRFVDQEVSKSGGIPLATCVELVLNGVCWPWLNRIIQLVRCELIGQTHYLAVTAPPSTEMSKKDDDCTRALIDALNGLTSSPGNVEEKLPVKPKSKKTIAPSTAKHMLPPTQQPGAPRRLPDRITYKSRARVNKSRQVASTDIACPESARKTHNVEEEEEDLFMKQLGYKPPRTTRKRSKIAFYVDNQEDNPFKSPPSNDASSSLQHQLDDDLYDPVESCPPLSGVQPRPRNLRLASRWNAIQQNATHNSPGPSISQSINTSSVHYPDPKTVATVEASLQRFTERLTTAYSQLSSLPIPNLVRPICHWLGLRWLDKGSQGQAGRFFSQSVGIAPTNLYMSILSSRLWESKSTTNSSHLDKWFQGFRISRDCCIPNHPLYSQDQDPVPTNSETTEPPASFTILQFCLVDEISTGPSSQQSAKSDELGSTSPTANGVSNQIPFGLGAKSEGYLVVTKYSGLCVSRLSNLRAETRVMHQFTQGGLKTFDEFDQLQVESLDSMQLEERVCYWRTRYKLDSRLETFISSLRRDWFTKDDFMWLTEASHPTAQSNSIVLILDRRLNYLPWEWILRDTSLESHQSLTITRNLSLPLVLAHLASQAVTNSSSFDPHKTFYVLNPEANLSFTQRVFQPLFNRFPTWSGVTGREPTADEVNSGFINHNMFVYLGHGSGSRFLLQTFNQGLSTQAVALILGCSSGKPRWEGRHEPYSSLVNHLLSGCPFVAGVLWDVTDRDMDRFTWEFFTQWLLTSSTCLTEQPNGSSLGQSLSRAAEACKLKHLVGRSVIVYGVPAEPAQGKLLSLPASIVSELKSQLK